MAQAVHRVHVHILLAQSTNNRCCRDPITRGQGAKQVIPNPTLRSTLLCLKRQAMLTVHNRGMTFGQATHVLVGSLLLGSLYFQIRLDDYATAQGRGGLSVVSLLLDSSSCSLCLVSRKQHAQNHFVLRFR